MDAKDYRADPCRASSLPFWKTEQVTVPENITILREDQFDMSESRGTDEPYFRLIHRLEGTERPAVPEPFSIVPCDAEGFARHIRECYTDECITADELRDCVRRPVYDPDLWIMVADATNGRMAASGIADADRRIGEGILEWIQVSPDYRRRGLGQFIVRELLYRMKGKVDFVTVSGKMNNPGNPLGMYLSCSFRDPVIWHVIRAGYEG